jgi:rhodanese-related sulfurtransferase
MFGSPLPEIDVNALADLLRSDEDFILLDVREDDELLLAKINDKRMRHAPLSLIASKGVAALPEQAQEKRLYIICHHGSRSVQVTRWLLKNGWKNAMNVRGGIDEYAHQVDRSVGMY